MTYDWLGVGQGDVPPGSSSDKWDCYLDGSSLPTDLGANQEQAPISNPLFVQGDAGSIVDLGDGNKGIQMKDLNAKGVFEYDTFGMRLPWTAISAEMAFRVDSYLGNYIMPLRILTKGAGSPGVAVCLALRIHDSHFEVCDASSWRILKDLGPVACGKFNTVCLYANAQSRSGGLVWNGQGLEFPRLSVQPAADPKASGQVWFGASNSDGRGGQSVVTIDWVGIGSEWTPNGSSAAGWDYYLDGSWNPAEIGDCAKEPAVNDVLVTHGDKGTIVDLGNGNKGLLLRDMDSKDNSCSLSVLAPSSSIAARFRVDSYEGSEIAPIFMSTAGNESPVLGVTILIRKDHFIFYDVRAKNALADLGPVAKGKFNVMYLFLDGPTKSAELTWNDRILRFTGLGAMPGNPFRKNGWARFGASGAYGLGGKSAVTFDWVGIGQGHVPANSPIQGWDYHFDGGRNPADN